MLCSGQQSFNVPTVTQSPFDCGPLSMEFLLLDSTESLIENVNVDALNPSDLLGGWLYVTSDQTKIVIDACESPSISDFSTWSNLIGMIWTQNTGTVAQLQAIDGFYIQLLPDCTQTQLVPPTTPAVTIQIQTILPSSYITAFSDTVRQTHGAQLHGAVTCGVRDCVSDSPYVTFDKVNQQFVFQSLIAADIPRNYTTLLTCHLPDFPTVPTLSFEVNFQVLPCAYTSINYASGVSGQIIQYVYASGMSGYYLDSILSTSPDCGYSSYTYSLDVVTLGTDRATLGVSVDNSFNPAQMIIDQYQIGTNQLVTLEWSVFPTANPNQILYPVKFQINFTTPCDTLTVTVPNLQNITLTYLGPTVFYTFDSFIDSVSQTLGVANSCGLWTYTLVSPRADESNYSLTKTSDQNWSLQYVTNASYVPNTNYPLTLSGYLNGVLKATTTVNLYLDQCKLVSMTASASNMLQDSGKYSYVIGSNQVAFIFQYDQIPGCGYSFSYQYAVNGVTGASLGWLIVNSSTTAGYPAFYAYSTAVSDAGIYQIDLTTSITDGVNTLSNVLSFEITLVDPCFTGLWDTQVVSDITQNALGPASIENFPMFSFNTQTTNTVDCQSRTYTLVPALSFVTIDNNNLMLTVTATDLSQVGNYFVSLMGSLDQYLGVTPYSVSFNIDVLACSLVSITSEVNLIKNGTIQAYQIGDPSLSFVFYYDQTPSCQYTYTFTYTVNGVMNPTLPWLTISTYGSLMYPSITVFTSDITYSGTQAMTLTTIATDGTSTFFDTVTFAFNFTNPCLSSIWQVSSLQNMATTVLANPTLTPQIFQAFSLQTSINCGTILYSLSPVLAFASISTGDMSISVIATFQSQVGTTAVQLQATLASYPSVVAGIALFDIVINQCLLNQISADSIQPSSFYYQIGDPSLTITQSYTQSPLCNYTFTYSCSVNGVSNPVLSWMSMSQTSAYLYPTLTIATSDTSFAGTYYYSLTTEVSDGTKTLTDTVTFYIILTDPCLTAAWNSVSINDMITSVLAIPSLAPQVYPQFSLQTAVACGAVNYDISPQQSFVTVNSSTLSITAISTTETDVGVYSLTLTGTLANYATISLSKTFNVTINPCTLNSVTIASTAFGFVISVSIFSTNGFILPIATYTQVPSCGYSPIYSFLANTVPSSSFQTQPFFLQLNSTSLQVFSNDYTLNGKSFVLQQQTTVGSYVLTQTGQVTFADPCISTKFVSQNISNAYAFISSGQIPVVVSLPMLSDSTSLAFPSATTTPTCFAQSVSVTSGGQPISFMTQSTSASNQVDLTFASSQVSNTGVHQVNVLYTLTRYPTITQLVSFNLTMYLLTSPVALPNQTYVIGSTVMTISSGLFSISPTSSILSFAYTAQLSNSSPLPSFISGVLTASNFQFSVYSAQSTDAGIYAIKLTTTVNGPGQSTVLSTSFNLAVSAPPANLTVNLPPYFVSPLTLNFTVNVGDGWQYQLPENADPQSSKVTVSAQLSTAVIFMTFTEGLLQVQPATTTATNAGTYSIQIQLKDALGAASSYLISFVVNPVTLTNQTSGQNATNSSSQNGNSTTQVAQQNTVASQPSAASTAQMENASGQAKQTFTQLASISTPMVQGSTFNWADAFAKTQKTKKTSKEIVAPDVILTKVTQTSNVILTFTQPMVNPPLELIQLATTYNKTLKKDQPALIVTILPGRQSNPSNLTFTYNITAYTTGSMTVQLNFVNPQLVSLWTDPDRVQIQFAGYFFFFDQNGLTIPEWKTLIKPIPKQLATDTTTAAVAAAAATIQSTTSGLMAGNFAMNLILSASLQQLWSMINTQQIIVLMPLFTVNIPTNAGLFFGFISNLAAFNLLPTDQFYADYFQVKQDDPGPINENFGNVGFSSMYFLNNMGTLVVIILTMPLLGVVSYSLKMFRKRGRRVNRLYIKVSSYLFWSHQITIAFESYSMICISVFINTTYMTYQTFGEIINSVCTIVFFVICAVLPFVFLTFLALNLPVLDKPQMKRKFGNLYANIDLRQGKWIAAVPFIFLMRRFAIGLSVVYQQTLIVQIVVLLAGVVAEVTTTGFVSPFIDSFQTNNDYFNEIIITVTLYTMMCFTDFVKDLNVRANIGYVSCMLVCTHLGVNVYFMISESAKQLVLKARRWFARRKAIQARIAKVKNAETQKEKQAHQNKKNLLVNSPRTPADISQEQAPRQLEQTNELQSSNIKLKNNSYITNPTEGTAIASSSQQVKALIDLAGAETIVNIENQRKDERQSARAQNAPPPKVDWEEFLEQINLQANQDNQHKELVRRAANNPLIPVSSQSIAEAQERVNLKKIRLNKAAIAQAIRAQNQPDGRTPSQRQIDELFPMNTNQEVTAVESADVAPQRSPTAIDNQYFYQDSIGEEQKQQFNKFKPNYPQIAKLSRNYKL